MFLFRAVRGGGVAVVAGLVLALSAAPVLAHAALVGSEPAADATATPAPTELRLTFSEGIELAFSKVVVTVADGAVVAEGTPVLDAADDKVLVVPLAGALSTGSYTVSWTAVATDGHKSSGTYSFAVAP